MKDTLTRMLESKIRPFILATIGASIPIISGFLIMQERFVRVETKQLEIIKDLEEHVDSRYHLGMTDWALSKEQFREWVIAQDKLELERFNNINQRLDGIEISQKEILEQTK